MFAHQLEINPQNLRAFAEKFAEEHKIGLPFVVDPDGKLAAMVRADKDVGVSLHIDHTPTIWIVSNKHESEFVVRAVGDVRPHAARRSGSLKSWTITPTVSPSER